jgi:uncharacterized protein YprB with RNaseH-like and TPR domain
MMVLDIETSGLDPKRDFITCIGVLTETTLRQFTAPFSSFNESPSSAEKLLLSNFCASIFDEEILYTYNGETFDLPFIYERVSYHELTLQDSPITREPGSKHYDLFDYAQRQFKRRVTKDEAVIKLTNTYVPRNSSGMFLARIYTQGIVTRQQHMDMLMHNAQDIIITSKFVDELEQYPDYRDWKTNYLKV